MDLVDRILILAALVIAVIMFVPPTSPLMSSSVTLPFLARGGDEEPVTRTVSAELPFSTPEPVEPVERPPKTAAKGILMSGYTAGGSRFETLLEMIERTELNAVVIDIKDESGEISWVPESPRAQMVGAGRPKMRNPRERIQRLKEAGVYVIGRIVSMQDPILAEARPDLAVQDTGGGIWRNEKGLGWADPYSPEVWAYLMSLAEEAIDLGFDEIQFDYIRFPTDGDVGTLWYPHQDTRERWEVIQQFFAHARRVIEPRGAYLSCDAFGFVTLATDDQGIGQKIELIAQEVDFLSLMLYPSHYTKGNYGLADPEEAPAQTISLSLEDAKRRIAGTRAELRPWLQDFSLAVRYTPREVRAQINAAEELGVDEWLLWNASNRYSADALRPAGVSGDD